MVRSPVVIQKLPQSTIQMIAAGEVITRPVNVIKELLENSLDAGATNIRINTEMVGLNLIEIVDNGHGISRENALLLCQRYTTSKLRSASDLTSISTFGFRGEALASISEMANIEVRSFNINTDQMGWEAKYMNGNLIGEPLKKYLQNTGTQIKVTNLFLPISQRKISVHLNQVDEKKAIYDLVLRYALHHRNKVTMSFKESHYPEIINVLAPMELKPCFGMFFGLEIENNIIEFVVHSSQQYKASIQVVFSYKKSTSGLHSSPLILFVNDRLVECGELKRNVSALLHEYYNSRQYQTVLYISIKVPAFDVDINTHPAKTTVALHYQEEIIASIVDSLRFRLRENLSSKSIDIGTSVQKTIGQLIKTPPSSQKNISSQTNHERLAILAPACLDRLASPAPALTPKRQYDLVHNDSSQLSLAQLSAAKKTRQIRTTHIDLSDDVTSNSLNSMKLDSNMDFKIKLDDENLIVNTPFSEPAIMQAPTRQRRDLKLRSIVDLRNQVAKEKTKNSLSTIKDSIFVGVFDHERALIQHETRLYAINLKAYLKEQYYQFYLFDFGNFPPIEILPPGNKIKFLIDTYLDDIKKHENDKFEKLKYQTTQSIIDLILKHAAMLEDYLTLKLNEEEIISIPCVIPDEIPNLVFLGRFLVDLVNEVDYSDERECFRMMGRVLAEFYSEPPANLKDKEVHRKYHDCIETKLYGVIKNYLLIPEWLLSKRNICQISDTKDLYKVFERC